MNPLIARLMPFGVFFILVLFFWRGLSLDPQQLPSVILGKPVPIFHIKSVYPKPVYFTSTALRGRIVLLNVWASWCAACQEEQVFLLQLAREGVPIYGIAYKDSLSAAKQWLSEWGNPYQLVGLDQNGHVGIDLGVYGTPETFLIDKNGIIRYRHAGLLNEQVWRNVFIPLINELEAVP